MTVSHDSLKRKLRLGCDTVESKDMQDELEAGNPSRAGGEAKPPARAAAGMPDEAVVHPIGLDGWAGGRATGALANQSGLSVLFDVPLCMLVGMYPVAQCRRSTGFHRVIINLHRLTRPYLPSI